MNWYTLAISEVVQLLQADSTLGLNNREAARRLASCGPNELPSKGSLRFWQMVLDQFKDIMVLVLLVATVISALLGEYVDALTIMAIVLLNATLGLFQEFRAERSLQMLKELTTPQATVVRNGKSLLIQASHLVPGDLVKIQQGDKIPADLRLLECYSLEVDESALTGESLPVAKNAALRVRPEALVGDRYNMLYMGTIVTRGHGLGITVTTGVKTEIGKIATLIHNVQDEPTPLQKRLNRLGRGLVKVCLLVCLVVTGLGIMQGRDWAEMFLTGVSLAVAAIPEGLPAAVTISLALGVQRMIKRKAIMRKLSAIETLGCTTVICSDKTGTLTKNEMTVTELWMPAGGKYTIGDNSQSLVVKQKNNLILNRLLEIISLCNNAELQPGPKKRWKVQGDPTEGALLVLANKAGFDYRRARQQYQMTGEIPFDSTRKRMSVFVTDPSGAHRIYTKGAVDVLLERCSYYLSANGPQPLTAQHSEKVRQVTETMSSEALRVLAATYRDRNIGETTDDPETNLVLVGLVGMVDPPRPETVRAIALAKKAGIRTYMVTGDHKLTAVAIGRQIGLITSGWDEAMTGQEMEVLSDAELNKRLERIRVLARVSPEHKLRLVRLLRQNGEIVAMTGDGVNDAPAIREADIGVAMGQSGTDVAKEAAAMVLSDDNYATIVAAIEEGRSIYENIRKFIRYLLGCNIGEILTMLLAAATNLPLPLIAVQILLMNLVTDGLPAIALSLDPVNPCIMNRPPRRVDAGIFSGGLLKTITIQGTLIALGTVGVFLYTLVNGSLLIEARTMAFSTLVISQLFYVFRCRGLDSQGFFADLVSNLYLTGAVLVSLGTHIVVLTHPALQKIFQVSTLSGSDWGIVLAVAFFVSWLQDLTVELAIALKQNIRKVLGMA